jgi:hypothetical protein
VSGWLCLVVPDDLPRPSYEELAALVVSLREELAQTRSELDRALARVAELEARLGADSSNSDRRPSSDGLGKPAPKPRSPCPRMSQTWPRLPQRPRSSTRRSEIGSNVAHPLARGDDHLSFLMHARYDAK